MLEYILKSGLCLLVLFSFYKIFMEGETFHKIKRFYLLLALVFSVILPLITITYNVELPAERLGETIIYSGQKATTSSEVNHWHEYLPTALIIFYSIGFLIFSFRFFRNLRSLVVEANENDQLKHLHYIYVLLGKKLDPHSFLRYIFLNKNEFKNDQISKAVLDHEKAHVDQRHSLDLLIIEISHVIFWFNPLFIYLKRSAKLNHEFLADQHVLKHDCDALEYSNILYQYSSGRHQNSLSSPMSHSLIKKRIIMITKNFSPRRLLLRAFIFLPILCGCIYLFNEDIVAKPIVSNSEKKLIELENFQQDKRTIKIKVVGEKIWLASKRVSLEDFSEELNNFTKDWSENDLKNPWFEIDFANSTTSFIEKLNSEYRKSKVSKISDTKFIAPGNIPQGGNTPPPPPPPVMRRNENIPPPPPPAKASPENSADREILFGISIDGNILKVDGKVIDPKDFGRTLDKITEGKSDAELDNYNFRMHVSDPAPGFMEELNAEFKKSRISKVTGHDILPPPPPVHRDEVLQVPRPPKPPKSAKPQNAPKPPKPPESPKAAKRGKFVTVEEELAAAESLEINYIKEEKDVRDQNLEDNSKIKYKNKQKVVPNPPPPPKTPEEVISEIEAEGGSFYYNGKKVTGDQIREVVNKKDNIQIKVTKEDDSPGKVEVNDNN